MPDRFPVLKLVQDQGVECVEDLCRHWQIIPGLEYHIEKTACIAFSSASPLASAMLDDRSAMVEAMVWFKVCW